MESYKGSQQVQCSLNQIRNIVIFKPISGKSLSLKQNKLLENPSSLCSICRCKGIVGTLGQDFASRLAKWQLSCQLKIPQRYVNNSFISINAAQPQSSSCSLLFDPDPSNCLHIQLTRTCPPQGIHSTTMISGPTSDNRNLKNRIRFQLCTLLVM